MSGDIHLVHGRTAIGTVGMRLAGALVLILVMEVTTTAIRAADVAPSDLQVATSLAHMVQMYYESVRVARSTVGNDAVKPVMHLDAEVGELSHVIGLDLARKLADSFSAIPLSDSESLWSALPATLHRPNLAMSALAHEPELNQGQVLSVAIAVRRSQPSSLQWVGFLPVGIEVVMVDQLVSKRYEDVPDARFAGMTLLLDRDQGTAYVDQAAVDRILGSRHGHLADDQRAAGAARYVAEPEPDQALLARLIASDPGRPQDTQSDVAFLVLQIAEAVLFMRTLEHCIHDPHMATMSGVIGNQPRLHGMFDEAVATLQQMARPRGATVVLPWLLAGIGDKPLRSYMYDICLKCLCIELIDNPGRYGIPTTVGKDPKRAALTLGTLDADRLAQLASRALVRIVDFFGVSIAAQLTRAGRHVELINLLEQLRRTYPSAMGCQHAYGMQLVQDGSLQDARIVVYEALEMYGTNAIRVLGLDILGQILDAEGQHASANLVVRQVLALAPGDAAALHAQVRHWVKAGDRSQAEHALEELIAAHPESGFVASAKAMLASAWPTR